MRVAPVDERQIFALGLAGLVAINAMTVTLSVNVTDMSPSERGVLNWVLLFALGIVASLVGSPLVRRAIRGARECTIVFEHLFVVAILGATGFSVVSMVSGAGPVYFEVAALLLVIHGLGEALSTFSRKRALERIRAFGDDEPASCRVRCADGSLVRRPLGAIAKKDVVVVHPGEEIPFDGVVQGGTALAKTALITGEPLPAFLSPGSTVYAGTSLIDATLEITCEAELGGRLRDRLQVELERALHRPSLWQSVADRWVRRFLPAVVLTSSATLLAGGLFSSWSEGFLSALAVLLVACPCAMGFAVPLATWMGFGFATARGLAPRAGDALERLASVDVLVFDKTGTLTDGDPQLVEMVATSGFRNDELLALAAAVGAESGHPLGRAFANEAHSALRVDHVRQLPGRGVEARVFVPETSRYRLVQVGRPELFLETELAEQDAGSPEPREEALKELTVWLSDPAGRRRIVIVVDGVLGGLALIDEQPHPCIGEAVERLQALGVDVRVATGDEPERAKRLGIRVYEAGLGPDDKRTRVKALRAQGKTVGFVGDGFNDAAAMAESDVGIAVDGGADLAERAAHWLWSGKDPRLLPAMIVRARRVQSVIRQNLGYAAVYNAVGIGAAVAGFLHPVLAAVLMVLSSLFVTWRTVLVLERPSDETAWRKPGRSTPPYESIARLQAPADIRDL